VPVTSSIRPVVSLQHPTDRIEPRRAQTIAADPGGPVPGPSAVQRQHGVVHLFQCVDQLIELPFHVPLDTK